MFTKSQTVAFIGQTTLHQAVQEANATKRSTLINQGLTQLKQMPQNINLQQVVPDLCKAGRYVEIVEICMIKK